MATPQTINDLVCYIEHHSGMKKLDDFGIQLKKTPMSPETLTIFLASTAEFFKEIPVGILALGLRVADDWMMHDRFGAVTRAASVLYSAVDEFGLHKLDKGIQQSHHTYFLEMAASFGIRENDLIRKEFILPEATTMATLTSSYYRKKSIPEGLGFHMASEVTSDIEFNLCLQGFCAFPDAYGLNGPHDPRLEFYQIHTEVEPMHGSTSRDAVLAYCEREPAAWDAIQNGADAFLNAYGNLFTALELTFKIEQYGEPNITN